MPPTEPATIVTEIAEPEHRWHDMLAAALDDARLVQARSWASTGLDAAKVEIAIVANPDPDVLRRFPKLRFVQSLWAGVERLVDHSALGADVVLARLVDPNLARAMAEAVTAHVMALHRDHPHYRRAQAERRWRSAVPLSAAARAVGFLGTGELARASIAALVPLGFPIWAWGRSPRDIPGARTMAGEAGLEAMLEAVDILVNLLPLTAETRGLVNGRLLARLKPGAAFVNVARGGHVVDEDLIAALDEGRLREAVLDVFATEPLPPEHPYWAHPRVHVFPHVAAPTDPASAVRIAARNIRAFREGGTITGLVDRARGY